jgi:hypothetical protein
MLLPVSGRKSRCHRTTLPSTSLTSFPRADGNFGMLEGTDLKSRDVKAQFIVGDG